MVGRQNDVKIDVFGMYHGVFDLFWGLSKFRNRLLFERDDQKRGLEG